MEGWGRFGCLFVFLYWYTLFVTFAKKLFFCFYSFGKQFGGKRGCDCLVLEPSEMIVVRTLKNAELFFDMLQFQL